MDKREYLRVVQVGTVAELARAIEAVTDFRLKIKEVDRKIDARRATALAPKSKNKPVVRFGPKFFAKLNQMPAVSIEVRETRSQLRKTCYGFRDRTTGERVYLRIDPGSVVEFRDSICGYLIGWRYLIPGLDRMRGEKRWDKVERLIRRLLFAKGIIVNKAVVDKYYRSTYPRVKLARRLVDLRINYVPWRLLRQRKKSEEALKPIP